MSALLTENSSDYSQAMVMTTSDRVADEAAWIRRAKRSDSRAFESLYRLHVDKVYGLCLRMTGNVSEAEDCTQDAFIQAWNKLQKFRGDSAFAFDRRNASRTESRPWPTHRRRHWLWAMSASSGTCPKPLTGCRQARVTYSFCMLCMAIAIKRPAACWASRQVPAKRSCTALAGSWHNS